MRRLLDGERFSHEGRFYTFDDALVAPRPLQSHLPILVGGSGPRKTLRTVALRADGWNTSGTVEEVRAKLDLLAEHCSDVGRDMARIEKTVSFPITLRDDRAAAADAYGALLAANGIDDDGGQHGAARIARRGRRRPPPLRRARLRDRHRPDAGPVRPRDDRPDGARRGAPGMSGRP